MSMITPEHEALLRQRHTQYYQQCNYCGKQWPCDVIVLLDEVKRLREKSKSEGAGRE